MPVLATLNRLFVIREPLVALAMGAGIVGLVAVARTWVMKDQRTLPREALLVAGVSLFLAPQVAPASFLLVAALAGLSRNRGWLVFTATAPLSYFGWGAGKWSFWMGFAQYFPAYATTIYCWLGGERGRMRSRRRAHRRG